MAWHEPELALREAAQAMTRQTAINLGCGDRRAAADLGLALLLISPE
jgi:hypothetical protein